MCNELTPLEERKLLSKVNNDVVDSMKTCLSLLGETFGSRIYDAVNIISNRLHTVDKIKTGLFGCEVDFSDDPVKREKISRENTGKCDEILNKILKERTCGHSTLFMNYVSVLYVKAKLDSDVGNIGSVNMFRFSKSDEHARPCDNLFIGKDMRLYKSWADFLENNQIPHNCLVLVPSGGTFSFKDGVLHTDIYHVTRYMKSFVEPILAGAGFVGMGIVCAPVTGAVAIAGAAFSGISAVGGITRGIIDLHDRGSHETLKSTGTIMPVIDILSNALCVHSTVGALRMAKFSKGILSSEKFMSSVLLTEEALRIGAVSRISLDIVVSLIAYKEKKLDLSTTVCRIAATCLFLYNVGILKAEFNFDESLKSLVRLLPSFLTYENVLKFVLWGQQNIFTNLPALNLTENMNEFAGLFSIVLDGVRHARRGDVAHLTRTLQRMMNVKWKLIFDNLQRCRKWVDENFKDDEYISNFTNIQMAVVYNVHETISRYMIENEANDVYIDLLMQQVIEFWKQLFTIIYPDQNPNIPHCTMIMRYILLKIDETVIQYHENEQARSSDTIRASTSAFREVPLTQDHYKVKAAVLFDLIHKDIMEGDVYSMSSECKEMIAKKQLTAIRYVIQTERAEVSFIQQQSDNVTDEEMYEDGYENPTAFCKMDTKTKLGVLIKYASA